MPLAPNNTAGALDVGRVSRQHVPTRLRVGQSGVKQIQSSDIGQAEVGIRHERERVTSLSRAVGSGRLVITILLLPRLLVVPPRWVAIPAGATLFIEQSWCQERAATQRFQARGSPLRGNGRVAYVIAASPQRRGERTN